MAETKAFRGVHKKYPESSHFNLEEEAQEEDFSCFQTVVACLSPPLLAPAPQVGLLLNALAQPGNAKVLAQ